MVTTEQREQFDREGYLIFDPELSHGTLDAIVSDLADEYKDSGPAIDVAERRKGRIQDAWRINSHVRAVALAPKTLAILEAIYGRRPLPFQTLNFPTGTEQRAHADAMHFNSIPPTFMCGVWVALEDVDSDNGPLVYYPGSHKLPEVTADDVMRSKQTFFQRAVSSFMRRPKTKDEAYPTYENIIAGLIEKHSLEPHYATINKGQALLWAANLLHGGAFQRDKFRSRHSQVTHYFFENCRYYTPILSLGNKITWRDPTWIV
jgi:ectoine hydroxylase-related dioxygenase (phytanoyl-CoA dioxygenase family)